MFFNLKRHKLELYEFIITRIQGFVKEAVKML